MSQTDALSGLAHAEALTGNASEAMRAYKEALEISKATGKSFGAVLLATSKAQEGNIGSLKRYGVEVAKGTTGQQQYTDVMAKFGGQAKANTTPMEQLRAHLSNISTDLGTKLLPAFDKLITGMNNVITWVQTHWPQISAIITPVIDAVKQSIEGIVQVIKGVFEVVDGLIHGRWSEVWKGLKDIAGGAIKNLVALPGLLLTEFGNAMGALAQAGIDAITGGLSGLAGLVTGWINDAVTAITGAVTGAGTAAAQFGAKILSSITGAVSSLAKDIGGYISGAVSAVTGKVVDAGNEAKKFGGKIFDGIDGAVTGIAKAVGGYITSAVAKVTGAISNAGTEAGKFGKKIFNSIDDAVSGIAKAIGGYLADVGTALTNKVKEVGKAAASFGGAILSGIGDGLAGLGKKLAAWIIDPINAVIGAIDDALNFTLPTVTVNTHLPGVGKITVGGESINLGVIPKIGGKASGGPVAAGVPYWVGELGPELFVPPKNGAIVPTSQSLAAAGLNASNGGTHLVLDFHFHAPVYGGPAGAREFTEIVRTELVKLSKRGGGPLAAFGVT